MREVPREGKGFSRTFQRLAVLLYPGTIAIFGFAPVGLLGPMAFAIRSDIEFPITIIGITFSLFFIGAALVSSMGSVILARIRASTVVRLGLGASSTLCIAMACAPSSNYVIALAFAAGLVNGMATPATNLALVQTVPSRQHGLAFGIKVAAIPVASSLAAFGAYAVTEAGVSWRVIFVLFGVVGLMILIVGLLRQTSGRHFRSTNIPGPRSTRPTPAMILLGVVGFLASNGTGFYTAFIVDSLINSGLTPATAAVIVGVVAWIGIACRLLAGVAADRMPRPAMQLNVIACAVFLAGAGMIGLVFGSGVFMLSISTVACFGIGWAWPGLLHHASATLFPQSRALAISLVQTGTHVGAVTGALTFGFIAGNATFNAAWIAPIISVVLAGVLVLLLGRSIEPIQHERREGES